MAKTERARIARTFKRAKKYLWDGKGDQGNKEEFICHCIKVACRDGEERAAIKIIDKRLGNSGTLEGWLRHKGIFGKDHLCPEIRTVQQYWVKLQATRLAWLNSLIAEFSK